jgi:hypothetical protein
MTITGTPEYSKHDGQTTPAATLENPALAELQVLLGEWQMTLSNAAFLPNPSDTVTGVVSFEALEDGALLVMHMDKKPTPAATWVFGRDESTPDYQVLYFDARKVSRIYQMSLSDGIWKMWREAPGFWQRFEGKLSGDGNTITAHWDKSTDDGATWEHDFDITYSRVK